VYKIGKNAIGKRNSHSFLYTKTKEQHSSVVNNKISNEKLSGTVRFSNSMAGSVIFIPLTFKLVLHIK
jgi:hypothetical protein